jgi:hypothetical protein
MVEEMIISKDKALKVIYKMVYLWSDPQQPI